MNPNVGRQAVNEDMRPTASWTAFLQSMWKYFDMKAKEDCNHSRNEGEIGRKQKSRAISKVRVTQPVPYKPKLGLWRNGTNGAPIKVSSIVQKALVQVS